MQITKPLRERQRLETWKAIHETAATLAMDRGLSETTVESIAELAGVSKRTFFNYFPTKEDAVLGFEPPEVSREVLAEFQAGSGDALGDAVRLMFAVVRSTTRLSSDSRRRLELIRRFPELHARLNHHAGVAERLVAPILSDKLPCSDTTVDDEDSHATALLMLAGTVTRFAYRHDPNVSAGNDALDFAIEIFRDIIKKAP